MGSGQIPQFARGTLKLVSVLDMSVASLKSEFFGHLPSGESVHVFTLENRQGMRLRAINLGAVVLSVEVPDRQGNPLDVVLGFSTFEEYLNNAPYFGAVVGRYGNRIAGGRFVLDGKQSSLALNNTPGGIPCALHGGVRGFDKVWWAAQERGGGAGVGGGPGGRDLMREQKRS